MFPSKTVPGSLFIPSVADLREHAAFLSASASGVDICVSPARCYVPDTMVPLMKKEGKVKNAPP
jgi:hypothetical protein